MALSGIFYGTTNNSMVKPKIVWSAVQNIAGNYSDITATLHYSRTNTGYTTSGTWEGMLTIGDRKFSGTQYLKITYNSDTVAISGTYRVYHDSYGDCTLIISATGKMPGTSLAETVISQKITLDTIDRASGISAANGDIGSRATIVIDRKNSAFTHTVAYRFGNLTGYINASGNAVAEPGKFSATTVNFLLPEAFYNQIPNDPSGTCTLTCTTYKGDTPIGEDTTTFTATASYSLCRPVLNPSVSDANSDAVKLTDDRELIRGISDAECTLQALPQKGATIRSMRINGVDAPNGTLTIPGIGQDSILFEATDSRGYTTQTLLYIPVSDYVLLTNNARVQRSDPTSGNAVLTLQGSFWVGNFGLMDNVLSGSYQIGNEAPVQVHLQPNADHTYRLDVPLSGLDYTRSYTITVIVRDLIEGEAKQLILKKGIPVFDWGETDFQFHVPVDVPEISINGISLADYIRNIIKGG